MHLYNLYLTTGYWLQMITTKFKVQKGPAKTSAETKQTVKNKRTKIGSGSDTVLSNVVTDNHPTTVQANSDSNWGIDTADKNSFFKEVIESEKTLEMEPDIWEKLFSKKSKKKDGKFLLPREWTRVFSETISEVSSFCCIAFNRHSLSKRASHIFSASLCCSIAGCTTKGDIYLYPNMKLVIKHPTNIVQHRKNQHDPQLPKEKCSKRLYLTALSQAKNITKILAKLMIAILMQVIFVTLETAKAYTNKLNTKT